MRCLLAFLLVSIAAAYSAPPEITFNAPTSAVPGSILDVTVDAPDAVHIKTRIKAKTEREGWLNIKERDGGRLFTLATPAGQVYEVTIIASNQDGISFVETVITIEGNAPAPPGPSPNPPSPNPPSPNPTPGPVWPPSKFGLAKVAYEAALKLSPETRRQAAALAGACISASDSIAAGQFKTLEEAKVGVARIQIEALGGLTEAAPWRTWFSELRPAMTGRMKTLDDFETALEEIANGLNLIK